MRSCGDNVSSKVWLSRFSTSRMSVSFMSGFVFIHVMFQAKDLTG